MGYLTSALASAGALLVLGAGVTGVASAGESLEPTQVRPTTTATSVPLHESPISNPTRHQIEVIYKATLQCLQRAGVDVRTSALDVTRYDVSASFGYATDTPESARAAAESDTRCRADLQAISTAWTTAAGPFPHEALANALEACSASDETMSVGDAQRQGSDLHVSCIAVAREQVLGIPAPR